MDTALCKNTCVCTFYIDTFAVPQMRPTDGTYPLPAEFRYPECRRGSRAQSAHARPVRFRFRRRACRRWRKFCITLPVSSSAVI